MVCLFTLKGINSCSRCICAYLLSNKNVYITVTLLIFFYYLSLNKICDYVSNSTFFSYPNYVKSNIFFNAFTPI